jgi:hypothetical protein
MSNKPDRESGRNKHKVEIFSLLARTWAFSQARTASFFNASTRAREAQPWGFPTDFRRAREATKKDLFHRADSEAGSPPDSLPRRGRIFIVSTRAPSLASAGALTELKSRCKTHISR